MPDNRHYETRLFRGWDVVSLAYELVDDAVVVRRKNTWTAPSEQRVPLANLTGDVNRVIARHPANRTAYVILLIVTLVLASDYVHMRFVATDRPLFVPLWIIGGVVALIGAAMFLTTTKPVQWSHFKAQAGKKGLFVLRDAKQVEAHAEFVARVARTAAEGAPETDED